MNPPVTPKTSLPCYLPEVIQPFVSPHFSVKGRVNGVVSGYLKRNKKPR
jgi:hypothetical protein